MSWTFDKAFLNPSLPVIFTDVCPWGILNPSFPLALTCERCLTEIKRETNRKTSKTHLIREILRDTHKCSGWNEAPDILTLSKDKIFSYLFRMLSHMLQPPRLSDLRGVKKKIPYSGVLWVQSGLNICRKSLNFFRGYWNLGPGKTCRWEMTWLLLPKNLICFE